MRRILPVILAVLAASPALADPELTPFALPPLSAEESLANAVVKELAAALGEDAKVKAFASGFGDKVGVCAFVSGTDPDSEKEVFWFKPDLAREVGDLVTAQANLVHVGREAEMDALLRQGYFPQPLWDLLRPASIKTPSARFEDLDGLIYVFVRRCEVAEGAAKSAAQLAFADDPTLLTSLPAPATGAPPTAVMVRLSLWNAHDNTQVWGRAGVRVYDPGVYQRLRRLIAAGAVEDAEAQLARLEAQNPELKDAFAGVREAIARRAARVELAQVDELLLAGQLDAAEARIADALTRATRRSVTWALEKRRLALAAARSEKERSAVQQRLALLGQLGLALPPAAFLDHLEASRARLPDDDEEVAQALTAMELVARARLRREVEAEVEALLEAELLEEAEAAASEALVSAQGPHKARLAGLLQVARKRRSSGLLASVDELLSQGLYADAEARARDGIASAEATSSAWLRSQLEQRLGLIRDAAGQDRVARLAALEGVIAPKALLQRVVAALGAASSEAERAGLENLRARVQQAADDATLRSVSVFVEVASPAEARAQLQAALQQHPGLSEELAILSAQLNARLEDEVREVEALRAAGRVAEARALAQRYASDVKVGAEMTRLIASLDSASKDLALVTRATEWLQEGRYQKVVDLGDLPGHSPDVLAGLEPLIRQARDALAIEASLAEASTAIDAGELAAAKGLLSAIEAQPGGGAERTAALRRRIAESEARQTQLLVGGGAVLAVLAIVLWLVLRQRGQDKALELQAHRQGMAQQQLDEARDAREARERAVAQDAELRGGVARSLGRAQQSVKDMELQLVRDKDSAGAARLRPLLQDLDRLRASIEDAPAGNAQRLYGASASDPKLKQLLEHDATTRELAQSVVQSAEMVAARGAGELDASVDELSQAITSLRTRVQERATFVVSAGG